ncbi:MAG: CoA transferase [Anaerolineae bacterium]
MATNLAGTYFATGEEPPRLGNAHPSITPYQVFRTRDGHIILAVGSERLWERFCAALGVEDTLRRDLRFATARDRNAHRRCGPCTRARHAAPLPPRPRGSGGRGFGADSQSLMRGGS